ncbi:putative nucleoporin [Aspergillus aculeatinus CBS 121060]|uniref:Uncharacterized protein n=1 Tax=Aspergillus aculeatinus CBS 121060 TaxID=1448322 RepID=A0ACD1GWZ5_9EURO|nr:hypothetical protein BO66DRAFT_358567 [Aspergillus aculeatinus CBS 121060]RAH65723.1 hypothetical protein BO66DRAFT_358567 [Aspergillus aculeatinus CBS 121060]
MSLFGQTPFQPSGGNSLFGNPSTDSKPNPFGANAQQGPGGGMFGNAGTGAATTGTGGGLFGQNTAAGTQQQPNTGGLFGATNTNAQSSTTGGGLFGNTNATQQKPAFGALPQQPQTQPASGLGGGGLFGGLGQKPQGTGLFGQQAQPQQQQQQSGLFGGSLLGQQQQQVPGLPAGQMGSTLQFGQSNAQQQSQLGSSLWEPGRAVTGVHRTVPMQIQIVKDKWDPNNRASPFRTYLYNNVGEDAAPFYQPGHGDDEAKWEDALRKRPEPGYVPVLVQGFFDLGKRAQRQKDFLTMLQTRMHEINNCLTELLSRHDLKISVRIADCRRKHLVLSKRCLTLAAKTQVLRNRGYAMDDAEEELRKKLTQLERSVFDPSINGRGEEIWARMLAIREHSRRLQQEMERAGPKATAQAEDELDEQTLKTAKKILDDYHVQIQHLQKELESVKKDFEESQKLPGGGAHLL